MVRKAIDPRIKTLIENSVASNHRSMFFIIGDEAKKLVPNIHYLLSKLGLKKRPSVLWCYKKDLGFSTNPAQRRKATKKKLRKKLKKGLVESARDDPFDLFINSTKIRYCYYKDSHKILGNTYGMLVLKDFESLSPNLLARTIETVQGGGAIVFLLERITTLKQIYTMTMDIHSRFRGGNVVVAGSESDPDRRTIVPRFNERFVLSLRSNPNCLLLDDEFNVLPLFKNAKYITPIREKVSPEGANKLRNLVESLEDVQVIPDILKMCQTYDQASTVLLLFNAISEMTLSTTVSITAPRGRGKSAALGLAISTAVALGYSNIFVTSPAPDNLKTLFEFVLRGFDALGMSEHTDYDLQRLPDTDLVVRINVFRDHRQTIQYISPADHERAAQAELLVIDEAAAIPVQMVKKLMGNFLVFISSTVDGYEGTGLSLKKNLIRGLKEKSQGRTIKEITMSEPIRYSPGDPIERWLNDLLLLNCRVPKRRSARLPNIESCNLYHVNRDVLFSNDPLSEDFLREIWSLITTSSYKNTPDDIVTLSDSPINEVFVLLSPVSQRELPEVIGVVQVSLEGRIAKNFLMQNFRDGIVGNEDVIPWIVSNYFGDDDFTSLSGARVVRIAVRPDMQRMGYGRRVLSQLEDYYSKKIAYEPADGLENALLVRLENRASEDVDYLGVSFGLTDKHFHFFTDSKYEPVYLGQEQNVVTGEYQCIALRGIRGISGISEFSKDFKTRLLNLLGYSFRDLSPDLVHSLLKATGTTATGTLWTSQTLSVLMTKYDLKRIGNFLGSIIDAEIILDLVPIVARIYFLSEGTEQFETLTKSEELVLALAGFQFLSQKEIERRLDLKKNQVSALYKKAIKVVYEGLERIVSEEYSKEFDDRMDLRRRVEREMEFLEAEVGVLSHGEIQESLEGEGNKILEEMQKRMIESLSNKDQFKVEQDPSSWQEALRSTKDLSTISVPRKAGSRVKKKRK